ncbi:MAG: hypothetical protein O3C69_01145 [Chloroflexi bacterium]|nr:hypothetical protein [Chloroflexota bacterium]
MSDNFTSELVDSAGEVFATDAIGGSSVHYPIGKLAWGPLNTANLTDTANPLPVQINGNGTSSSAPFFVRGANDDSTVPISGTVSPAAGASFAVAVDSADIIRAKLVESDSNGPVFSEGDSAVAARFFAVGFESDSVANVFSVISSGRPLPVQGDTVVSITGYVAPSTAVTVTNMSDSTVTVSGTVTVQGNASVAIVAGSSVSISNDSAGQIGVGLNAIGGNSAGAHQTFTTVLSSALETVTSSAGRLYGYMLTNPDTAAIVYAKIFSDDSTGVTKGTTSPVLNLGIPPVGGANVTFAQGVLMSSGMSVMAAGGAGLTDTSAPGSNLVVNLFYKG